MSNVTSSVVFREATAVPVAARRAVLRQFFSRWPGQESANVGFGRAVVDFQEWEITSGRISDATNSPWWSAMNGQLVLDLRAATTAIEQGQDGFASPSAVAAWVRYTRATGPTAQAALWSAHQESITQAAIRFAPLLAAEPEAERRFATLVLAVVERSAELRVPTDDLLLGEVTRGTYPSTYPITAAELVKVTAMLDSHETNRPRGGSQAGNR